MLDTLLDYAIKEWGVIREAPVAFLLCVLFLGLIIFLGLEWFHSEKSETQEQRISFLSERLDESRISLKTTTDSLSKSQALAKTARLELQFYGDERNPIRIGDAENVWRYFYQRFVAARSPDSQDKDAPPIIDIGTALYVNFDQPVSVGTVTVSSPNIRLPIYHVMEFNNRFVIVTFSAPIPFGTVVVSVAP